MSTFLGHQERRDTILFKPLFVEESWYNAWSFLPGPLDSLQFMRNCDFDIIPLSPMNCSRAVAACDASIIRVAETPLATLLAARGAVVARDKNSIKLTTYGPFLSWIPRNYMNPHTTEYSLDFSHGLLGKLERAIQRDIANLFTNSLILFDGALSPSYVEGSRGSLKSTLEAARLRGNAVLAFSKTSSLAPTKESAITSKENLGRPCVLRILRPKVGVFPFESLGRIYVAHLDASDFWFRLDVYSEDPNHDIESIRQLLASDSVIRGYPETLILAHQYSSFNRIELVSLQTIARAKFGVNATSSPDVRESLFRPIDR